MKIEYNNLYTHFIISTLHRMPLIAEKNRVRIEKYITGIVKYNESQLYSIFANPEHLHILISRSPVLSEEQLATIIADSSEDFIIKNGLCKSSFAWQQTAAAFSVSKKDVNRVCKYILNQAEHHRKISFAEEYETFLKYYQKTIR